MELSLNRFVYKVGDGNPVNIRALWGMDVFDFFWYVYDRQEETRAQIAKRNKIRGITPEEEAHYGGPQI